MAVSGLCLTYDPKKLVLRYKETGEREKIGFKVGAREWEALRSCTTLGEWNRAAQDLLGRAKAEKRIFLGSS